ncbi:MAG: hypothetical protein M1819_006043 [Sarea resinae]|nr:MAG: hypothetical protein M1819_006043 [Sarea resinae]
MADAQVDHDALITQFCSLTGVAPHEAEQYLATNQWDLSTAATEYYTSQEEGVAEAESDSFVPPQEQEEDVSLAPSVPGGGRTLGGGPAPPQAIPTTSSAAPPRSASAPRSKKMFATLGDLNREQPHSHGHGGHDPDSDDDDEDQDFFAGGEKSGLAVQNPGDARDQVKNILAKARKGIPRPGGDDPAAPSSHFRGTARTLGGDDTPSEMIPDPTADAEADVPRRASPVQRILHLWRDGFSVDDGDLYRFDDPANAGLLQMINQGRAPLEIMDVRPDQAVDVQVSPHDENYVQPKRAYKPFSGGGHRLGSPAPGDSSSSSSRPSSAPRGAASASSTTTAAAAAAAAAASSTAPTTVDINESQPTISLQVRLGDGTRLVSRFNTTHTIGDVYAFVNASSPASAQRPWVLMTTFPSKELTDKHVALGDLAEFRRGGVVVQKWQ